MAARAALLRPVSRGLRHLRAAPRPRSATSRARPAVSASSPPSLGLDLDPAAAAGATPIHPVLTSELDGLAARLGACRRRCGSKSKQPRTASATARRAAAPERRWAAAIRPARAHHARALALRRSLAGAEAAAPGRHVTGSDAAAWAAAAGFKAEAGKALLLPGPGGSLAGVLFGLVRTLLGAARRKQLAPATHDPFASPFLLCRATARTPSR